MEKIAIKTTCCISEIRVGEKWERGFGLIPMSNSVIITDDNVLMLYGSRFPELPVFSLKPGEESKRMSVIEELSEKLLSAGIDRSGYILAIGGGVVSDVAGFLAAVYMRGIRCGYISTTLLSQVDASTGGKNGVNLEGTKNMIGTIRQPEFVICDPEMLYTLTDEEFLSGLAELIKTAIIGDSDLFTLLENNTEDILKRRPALITDLVARSVRFKAEVVEKDEMEIGLRRILNFGHTFGHVIEMEKGIRHGLAIASGMELAIAFSFEKGLLNEGDMVRINNLLKKFGFSNQHNISPERLENLILHDKKKTGNSINFVFSKGIGKAVVEKVQVEELSGFYNRFKENK